MDRSTYANAMRAAAQLASLLMSKSARAPLIRVTSEEQMKLLTRRGRRLVKVGSNPYADATRRNGVGRPPAVNLARMERARG